MASQTVSRETLPPAFRSPRYNSPLNQLQEFVPVAGIEIVGPFSSDLQLTTVFSAVIMGGATNVDVAKAVINFLRTADAAKVIKAKGLEPATP